MCPVNEYIGGAPEACQPCPARSSSPGGVVRVCSCMDSTGRVNDSDPSLPCVGESLAGNMLSITLFVLVESIHCIISVYYRLHDCVRFLIIMQSSANIRIDKSFSQLQP